jgi:hypothetical protein
MTDQGILHSVASNLGFGTIFHEKRKPPQKDCYFLRFHRHDMKRRFIEVIRPYVRLKGPQLDLATKILDCEQPRVRLSDLALEIRAKAALELKRLNKKGVSCEVV